MTSPVYVSYDTTTFQKHNQEADDGTAQPKRRRRRRVTAVQHEPAFQSSPLQSYPLQSALDHFETSSGHGKAEVSISPEMTRSKMHKKHMDLVEAMGYPRSSFFNAPETARLITGLERAIDREGLGNSSFIKKVRAEGALQVEDQRRDDMAVVVSEGYRNAWLQGLINHALMLARILLPTIEVMSPEDRKKWCLHRADEYFKQWMMLEEIDEDVDDSRVAKGMLLLRAYWTRFIRLEGQTLIDAMMENPPTDRAMTLPRPSRLGVGDLQPVQAVLLSGRSLRQK